MKRPFALAALATALQLSSCATIFSGTRDEVEIRTSDPDAELVIDGKSHGCGTQTIELERDKDHIIEVIPTKGDSRRVNLNPKFNILIIFNAIIPGGAVASFIDWMTGSAFDLEPDCVEFDFTQPDGSQYKDQQ